MLLKNGYFYINTTGFASGHISRFMDEWYREKAAHYFTKIFAECWEKFKRNNVSKPAIKIMKMKKRWRSLTQSGALTLNLALIKIPKTCIEYVIHELCRLQHHHHGSEFY